MNYYRIIRRFLFGLPEEMAHNLALAALKRNLLPHRMLTPCPQLSQTVWGLPFKHPVGLAAGFDKNAVAIKGLFAQGFSFIEAGTVTPKPQPGNPKPRLFRLEKDLAVINRMGMPNKGIKPFTGKLKEAMLFNGIVGANIGKNKDTENPAEDYVKLLEKTYGLSDYITINISSPNTPHLRELQKKEHLGALLREITDRKNALITATDRIIPLLIKMDPDLDDEQRRDLVELALEYHIDGLIVSNTTLHERESLKSRHARQQGGLSGRPLFNRSTAALRDVYRLTEGRIPLIGVGGIASGDDAYAKIRAGASLLQLYTALIYQGFDVIENINMRLCALLERDGLNHLFDAVGLDAR